MIGVGLGYGVIDGDALDVAAGLNVPVNFGDGDKIPAISVDADTRYVMMDGALAIRTGHGLVKYIMGDDGGVMVGLNLGLIDQVAEAVDVDIDTPL